MPARSTRHRSCQGAGALSAALLLASCAAAASRSPPAQPPPPTPTPTVVISFAVRVTPVPLLHRRRRPRPTAVPFVPPPGPYLLLAPDSGLPASRTIRVRGANFPRAVAVSLVWSPGGRASGISTTAWTDRSGRLTTSLSIPGSPPGAYDVVAEANGVPLAHARYRIVSPARLSIRVTPGPAGVHIEVEGKRFLARLRLLLIAYPLFRPGKPLVLGEVTAGSKGGFRFALTRRLEPGEYALRAVSTNQLVAQTVDTFFQVVV